MKKILFFVLALASITSANDEAVFCNEIQKSFPSVIKVGEDTFSILDGKRVVCADHSTNEWKNLVAENEIYGLLLGINYVFGKCNDSPYEKVVDDAIKTKAKTKNEIQDIAAKYQSQFEKCSGGTK